MLTPESPAARPELDSTLCVACGMCCQGVLHRIATLDAEDVDKARALGLPVEPEAAPTAFRLPCPRLEGTACTVYDERPQVCRRYACGVLADFRAGTLAHETALEHIATAREHWATVRALLGPDPKGLGPWRQVEALAAEEGLSPDAPAFRQAHTELVMALTVLGLFLDRHFRPAEDA